MGRIVCCNTTMAPNDNDLQIGPLSPGARSAFKPQRCKYMVCVQHVMSQIELAPDFDVHSYLKQRLI